MKSKLQKRQEAAERIKKEIDEIEKLPENQISTYRLRNLKCEYNKLINYKTTKEKIKERYIRMNEYNSKIKNKVLPKNIIFKGN
ncbi:MAG: hypothetical protein PHF86_14440 [Candidatus Nanoarchaeia archaeon]|nr:hypothetical protein [Candidatus Nanoarchaeia archaeon]